MTEDSLTPATEGDSEPENAALVRFTLIDMFAEATIIAVDFSGPDKHSIRLISANREH
jgi:hypothetical protein